MKVLVIGGGIGGLALALSLRRVGIEAVVFERAPAFGAVGAGLTLWTNAMIALERMGAADAVRSVAAAVERGEVRSWRGALVTEMPIGAITRELGAPTVALHRADLHGALLKLLPPDAVHPASECVGFVQQGAEVIARFKGDREERGDVLVGADGIRSVIRAQLLGDVPLRYSGYVGWQSAARVEPAACSEGLWRLFIGRGSQFGIVPIGQGRVYWFGTRNLPKGAAPDPRGRRVELEGLFQGWPAPVSSVIGSADEAGILRTELSDRDPVEKWGEGRVTLLGDAVHPMTPNVGQGGCQAIEDAVTLAGSLRGQSDVVGALRAYEAARKKRTSSIVLEARRMGRILQWEGGVACALRNWAWRRMPEALSLGRIRRLLTCSVPQLPPVVQ